MAVYSAIELKNKMSGGKTRELDMPKNVQKEIVIPFDKFVYVKRHFNLNLVPGIKTQKKVVSCNNDEIGKNKGQCPICNYVDELWASYRSASTKEDKEKYLTIINKLNDEKIYTNCIDLSDSEEKFFAVKFTVAKFKELLLVIENNPIDKIKWLYKKVVKADKNGKDRTSYTLTEIINDKNAIEISSRIEELAARSYDNGGPIDLQAAYIKNQTKQEILDYLNDYDSDEEHDNEHDNDHKLVVEKSVSTSLKQKEQNKVTSKVVEDDLSLDDDDLSLEKDTLSLDEDDTSLGDDDLSLDGDDLSLDDLTLDDRVKMVPLTLDFIKTNCKNKSLMIPIIEYFDEKKIIKMEHDYNKDIKTIFNWLKTNKIEVPESLLEDIGM